MIERQSATVRLWFETENGNFELRQVAGNYIQFKTPIPDGINAGVVVVEVDGHRSAKPRKFIKHVAGLTYKTVTPNEH